jgi:hypothetical protein
VAKRRQVEVAEETTGVSGKGAKAVPAQENLPVRIPILVFLYFNDAHCYYFTRRINLVQVQTIPLITPRGFTTAQILSSLHIHPNCQNRAHIPLYIPNEFEYTFFPAKNPSQSSSAAAIRLGLVGTG